MQLSKTARLGAYVAAVLAIAILLVLRLRSEPAAEVASPARLATRVEPLREESTHRAEPSSRPVRKEPGIVPVAQARDRATVTSQAQPAALDQVIDPSVRTSTLSPMHQAWVNRSSKEAIVRSFLARHEELAQEPKDPVWGDGTETNVLGYFSKRPASVGLELLGASCRSSACEIQAADAQPSERGAQIGQAFLNSMLHQPWARTDIEDMQLFVTQIDGRTVYWAYLIRKQPDGSRAAQPPFPPTRK